MHAIFRTYPSVEQIKVDIAAAQDQAHALAADFRAVLQGCGERRGALCSHLGVRTITFNYRT